MARFCPNCGASLNDEAVLCHNCGFTLPAAGAANAQPQQPAYQPPQPPQPVYQAPQPQQGAYTPQQPAYTAPQQGAYTPQQPGYPAYPAATAAPKKSTGTKTAVIIVIALVLVIGGIVAAVILLSGKSGGSSSENKLKNYLKSDEFREVLDEIPESLEINAVLEDDKTVVFIFIYDDVIDSASLPAVRQSLKNTFDGQKAEIAEELRDAYKAIKDECGVKGVSFRVRVVDENNTNLYETSISFD